MSRFPYQGVLQTQTAPLVASGSNPLRAITNLLGAPQQNYPFSPDDVRATETFTLQRLAEGKPDYIGFTITSAMQSANPAILQIMPMLRTNAIQFIHEYFSFPSELAIETPHQAPPGYVEVEKSSRSQSLTSFALGATTTVQELRTSEGQFIFRGKLITVAIGFIQAAELLAIRALLETPSLYAMYYIAAGQHPIDLARTGRMQSVYFDILRRRDNGFAELLDLMRQTFSQQRIAPTHVIMPEGMRSLMMASPMKQEYYRNGPGASQNAEQLGDAVGDTFDGIKFVVIRAYELRKKDLRIHPLERNTIEGQHFRLDCFHPQANLANYSDKWTTSLVFSMESNMLDPIGSDDALEYDGRFSRSDGRLHDWHYHLKENLLAEAARSGVPIHAGQYDLFMYTSRDSSGTPTINVTSLWGHIEGWALTEETVERVAVTFAYAVQRVLTQAEVMAIGAGIDDIRELYENELPANDVAYMASPGVIGRYGVRELPTNDPANPFVDNYKPAGYGSVAGYLTISETRGRPGYEYLDQSLVQRSSAFRRAAVKLHKFMLSVYDMTHVALSPLYAPLSFTLSGRVSDTESGRTLRSFLNFFQNIVDTPKASLYVNVGGTNSGPRLPAYEPIEDDTSALVRLNDIMEVVGDVPALVGALGTDATRAAFTRAFAVSAFGRRYGDYLASETADSRRSARLSTDIEAGEDIVEGGTLLEKFFAREVLRQPTTEKQAALLAAVGKYVTEKEAPRRVNKAVIDSLASVSGDDLVGLLQGGAPTGTPTAFVASVDAVRGSGNDAISIVSPFNPTQTLNVNNLTEAEATLADATGANTNILRTTIFAGAHSSAMPGVRDAPPANETGVRIGARVSTTGGALPGFARGAFTDIAGSEVVVNEHIQKRYSDYGRIADWLKRVAAQMFILAPITKQTLLAFKRYDVALPVAWLVEQPNRRYRTASMIFLRQPGNEPVGNVRYMDPDTHVGRNIINKNLTYNVTMEMGATVNDVSNWCIAHDVAVVGYDGGENTKAFDQEDWNINALNQLPLDGPSLLYFMVPAGSLIGKADGKTPLEHDIRGYANAMNYSGASVHRNSQWAERPYYKSALYYTSKLGLNRIRTPTSDDWHRFHRRDNTLNTVTQQGFQKVINPHTSNYDFCIMPQDSFGTSVYPGCRELRESLLPRVYEQKHYDQISIPV